MLLQGQTGATAVGTQSDKLGQLACTTRFDIHCTYLRMKGGVSGMQACCTLTVFFLSMTLISFSPIVALLNPQAV